MAATTALIGGVLGASGCSFEQKVDPTVPLVDVTFTDVRAGFAADDYAIGSSARGVTDGVGSRLTININVTNANGVVINPKAVITYADGTTDTCQETDLRRLPNLQASTTSWDLPCGDDFPEDISGASVVVTDDYE
ncbi:hypothetical protein [Cellulomonas sp. HD19AZ1]|uniref:hypothetical protein n=1 Tax=Cellulomonas sp. HD19AZ1 TaxID=2559593 RepID=UPI001070A1A2|nr:hypothetical protein [Cellulomonas sp. HD19AZ1]TFH74447.1 hypothetical protein E4A51_03190 [Cellulomonas sp. HD19AZ1]